MEINSLLKEYEIIGLISSYELKIKDGYVKDLSIKDISKALKMVLLDDSYLDKKISDLTLNEQFKIDLLTKFNNDLIVVGNLSKYLNYKDIEYFKKLLLKLNNSYHKKIVVIDNDIKVFFNLVKMIVVIKDKKVLYTTNDFFDNNLYKYTKCPKIISFINEVNSSKVILNKTIDIYELIKDIYRSV